MYYVCVFIYTYIYIYIYICIKFVQMPYIQTSLPGGVLFKANIRQHF